MAKLKKDLKRTKALLKDAQMMIEKSQNEGTNKVIMRQLKNQVAEKPIKCTFSNNRPFFSNQSHTSTNLNALPRGDRSCLSLRKQSFS